MLTQLIEDHQDCEDPDEQKILAKWMAERDKLRYDRLDMVLLGQNTIWYQLVEIFNCFVCYLMEILWKSDSLSSIFQV